MNRKLRLGMVGGGIGGHMGLVHRTAALMDGRYELVAGSFSSSHERCLESAKRWMIDPKRAYTDYSAMIAIEGNRSDPIDVVSIVTPNQLHFDACVAFLRAGISIFCENPVSCSSEEIRFLQDLSQKNDAYFAVGFGYSAYPMIRLARDMVSRGDVGDVRSVILDYVSEYETVMKNPNHWRNDPELAGPLGAMADIGTHALHLGTYISGAYISEVAADLCTFVEGRNLDDYGTVLLRFSDGIKGSLVCTSAAPGNENSIRVRINGSLGALDWYHEQPNCLKFTRYGEPSSCITRGGHLQTEASRASTRIPKGHPEGFFEAYGNLFSALADAIQGHKKTGTESGFDFPTLRDAEMSARCMEALIASNAANSQWTPVQNL